MQRRQHNHIFQIGPRALARAIREHYACTCDACTCSACNFIDMHVMTREYARDWYEGLHREGPPETDSLNPTDP